MQEFNALFCKAEVNISESRATSKGEIMVQKTLVWSKQSAADLQEIYP